MRKAFIIFLMVFVAVIAYFYKQTESEAFGFKANGLDGCGVGLAGGLGIQQNDVAFGTLANINGIGSDSSLGELSVFCEVMMMEKYLIGIRAAYGWEDTSPSATILGTTLSIESQDYTSVLGKLGYVMPDRKTVIYGLAGVGTLKRGSIVGGFTSIPLPDTNHTIVGGGIEYFFNPNLSLGFEGQSWLRSDYNVGGITVDATQLQFTARLSIKAAAAPAVTPFQPVLSPPLIDQRPIK